jgi:ferredoxin
MKILIDPDLCTGHGRCYALAPDVFEADDDGFSVPRGEPFEVPAGRADGARLGADSCPEGAINLLD